MPANREQIEYWNTDAGAHWVAEADRYDALLGPLGVLALEAARIEPGHRVLDIGCGNGDTTLEIARRVVPAGEAVGVDISTPMLDVARGRAGQARTDNVSFLNADAQTHPFEPNAFDRAFSRFGVMFFDDPVAAFANIRVALRPGGRLAFVCWQALALNEYIRLPIEAAAEHVPLPPPADPNAPGQFAFADRERLGGILLDATYGDIDVQAVSHVMVMSGAPAEIATFLVGRKQIQTLLAGADAGTEAAVVQSLRTSLESRATPAGVELSGAFWLVTASA